MALDQLERAFLVAVDRVTRETYGYADGAEVVAVMRASRVRLPENLHVLDNMARRLRDGGYLADNTYFGGYADDLRGVQNISLTELGRDEAREIDPFEQVAGEMRRVFASEGFAEEFPDAFGKWASAERALYADDAEARLTAIGHDAREAMQAFATALVEAHEPPGVDTETAHVEKRLGAVIALCLPEFGRAHRQALIALGTMWEATSRLVQRQEHGAQREGEALDWSDARRVVSLTMFCMLELAALFEELPPPAVATLESGR